MHEVLSAVAANPRIYHVFQGSAGGETQLTAGGLLHQDHTTFLSEEHYSFYILVCTLKEKKNFSDTDS